MKMQPPKDRAKAKVIDKYRRLYRPLTELVDAITGLGARRYAC